MAPVQTHTPLRRSQVEAAVGRGRQGLEPCRSKRQQATMRALDDRSAGQCTGELGTSPGRFQDPAAATWRRSPDPNGFDFQPRERIARIFDAQESPREHGPIISTVARILARILSGLRERYSADSGPDSGRTLTRTKEASSRHPANIRVKITRMPVTSSRFSASDSASRTSR